MPKSSSDCRQRWRVVTAEGLGVDRSLLGRRLRSPAKRCAAIAVDLIFVAVLTNTHDEVALATVLGASMLWLFLRRAQGRSWHWRVPAGLFIAVLVVFFVLELSQQDPSYSPSTASWAEFSEAMASSDSEVRQRALEVLEAELEESQDAVAERYGMMDREAEDGGMREQRRQVLEVVRENHDLRQLVENPILFRTLRALAGDLGLELGWAGVYFLLRAK